MTKRKRQNDDNDGEDDGANDSSFRRKRKRARTDSPPRSLSYARIPAPKHQIHQKQTVNNGHDKRRNGFKPFRTPQLRRKHRAFTSIKNNDSPKVVVKLEPREVSPRDVTTTRTMTMTTAIVAAAETKITTKSPSLKKEENNIVTPYNEIVRRCASPQSQALQVHDRPNAVVSPAEASVTTAIPASALSIDTTTNTLSDEFEVKSISLRDLPQQRLDEEEPHKPRTQNKQRQCLSFFIFTLIFGFLIAFSSLSSFFYSHQSIRLIDILFSSLHVDHNELLKTIDDMKLSLEQHQRQITLTQQRYMQSETRLLHSQNALQQAQKGKEQTLRDLEQASKRIKQSVLQLQNQERELEKTQQENKHGQEQLEKRTQEVKHHASAAAAAQGELQAVRTEKLTIERTLQQTQHRTLSLSSELHQRAQQMESLHQDKMNLLQSLTHLNQHMQNVNASLWTTKLQLQSSTRENHFLRHGIHRTREQINQLRLGLVRLSQWKAYDISSDFELESYPTTLPHLDVQKSRINRIKDFPLRMNSYYLSKFSRQLVILVEERQIQIRRQQSPRLSIKLGKKEKQSPARATVLFKNLVFLKLRLLQMHQGEVFAVEKGRQANEKSILELQQAKESLADAQEEIKHLETRLLEYEHLAPSVVNSAVGAAIEHEIEMAAAIVNGALQQIITMPQYIKGWG